MKVINVTELKAHLSRYLWLGSRGTLVVVKDREEPIAQLGPPQGEALTWRERLSREGGLRLGTQDWAKLEISKLHPPVDIQSSLRAVREDASEARRR
jgi:antitoxin (DNA-binding transcriptional repressor) of toxin-antitoxin stability system